MNKTKTLSTLLLIISIISFYFNFFPQLILPVFFFYTSYVLVSVFTKNFLVRIAFTPAALIVLTVTSLFISNFISLTLFMPILFIINFILFQKAKTPEVQLKKKHLILLGIIILSAGILHFLIYQKFNFQLIGTDISRFGILSKTFEIKGKITPDLTPYDLPTSFFYFPAAYSIPLGFSFAGIDPISSITLFSFVLNLCAIIGFYLFSRGFLDNEIQCLLAAFFYAFFLDHVLDYLVIRAVFSYAWSIYFFFITAYLLTKAWREKFNNGLIIIAVTGILFTHWYTFFPLMFLFMSFSVHEFIKKGTLKKTVDFLKKIFKPLSISLILTIPFFIIFAPHMNDRFLPMNWAEHKVAGSYFASQNISQRIINSFLSHGAFMNVTLPLYGFMTILLILLIKKFINKKRISLLLFYVFSMIFSMLLYQSLTFRRMIDFPKFIFPMVFALLVDDNKPILIMFLLLLPFLIINPLYYFMNLNQPELESIDSVKKEEIAAFQFIKTLPENSTIMIDGGGTGCIAGSEGSHGDRIFPLTGKKVFLFTNYCWANYNRSEFEARLDLFRYLSINSNDTETLEKLTNDYGVTHIYIGPNSLGLRTHDLKKSGYYEEVFNENKTSVFEITY
ncbi:MAG: hypothetical protein GOU97_03170 [Nanoarchaeota archaeon]|nr:hypothetical protein [Nanoarchaeota archaeon]